MRERKSQRQEEQGWILERQRLGGVMISVGSEISARRPVEVCFTDLWRASTTYITASVARRRGWTLERLLALLLMEKQADVSSGQKEEGSVTHTACVYRRRLSISLNPPSIPTEASANITHTHIYQS